MKSFDLVLPPDFIEFYKTSNGAYLEGEQWSTELWSVVEMIECNEKYKADEMYPGFFLFGTDGIGNAFGIQKSTGCYFEIPWICDPEEDSVLISKTFPEFIWKRLN